jgi:hypothetical protein
MPEDNGNNPAAKQTQACGVIMPISAIDGCLEDHWIDVKSILFDSIRHAGFKPNLVSDQDDSGIIHKRIIQNLYDNPIVVCDVSARNPNVMFELGIRLAFDRPTIIVKDHVTPYTFDTGVIEHLEYPRDLRFGHIVEFKRRLAEKVTKTHQASSDPNYTTFLKNFGEFRVAKIEQKEVSGAEFILAELKDIKESIKRVERSKVFGESAKAGSRVTGVMVSKGITVCPECQGPLENASGCDFCRDCGYSKVRA